MRSEYDKACDVIIEKVEAAGYTAIGIQNPSDGLWEVTGKRAGVRVLLGTGQTWREAIQDAKEYIS